MNIAPSFLHQFPWKKLHWNHNYKGYKLNTKNPLKTCATPYPLHISCQTGLSQLMNSYNHFQFPCHILHQLFVYFHPMSLPPHLFLFYLMWRTFPIYLNIWQSLVHPFQLLDPHLLWTEFILLQRVLLAALRPTPCWHILTQCWCTLRTWIIHIWRELGWKVN